MKKTLKVLAGIAAFGFLQSCTNLDETLYSQISQDTFYQDLAQFNAAVGPAYSSLRDISWAQHNCQIVTTDEGIVPTRGSDWFDNGRWQALHKHTWDPLTEEMGGLWGYSFGGIGRVNQLLFTVNNLTVQVAAKDQIVSELKSLRAYFYQTAMDNFGGVPLATDFTDTKPKARSTRTEIFNFVEKEYKDALPKLAQGGNQETYSKMTKMAVQGMLARLYLNAEVYTGTARWDDCIAACDAILASNLYSLEADYFANFRTNNQGSKENIWVIPFDANQAGGLNFHMRTLHYGHKSTYNLQDSPWNGFATLAERYDAYGAGDRRRGDNRNAGFLIGQQLDAGGAPLKESDTGNPLIITKEIPSISTASQSHGVRVLKYVLNDGSRNDTDADYVMIRLADVLMMKAEALMRKNGGTANATALALVNQVRARAGATAWTLAQLTLPSLLNERGRELYWEGTRRTDTIRFGVFNTALQHRPARADKTREVYAIPQSAIDNNKLIIQNTGY